MARPLFPLQSFHTHTELTPALWDGDKMKPEVRKRLMEIAKTFEESLGIPVKVQDVWLTGSTANYNWSEFSDIDLHLLIDFSEIDEDEEMVRELMLAKKSVFNEEHDIHIGPFEVELYAQDVNEPHEATGVFSVKKDRWVRKPKQENPRLDLVAVKRKAKSMMRMIDNALSKDSCDSACLDRAMDRVKKMRKAGLDKGGEYSVENLAFKVLRRNGYLEKLWTEQRKRLDKELSLPTRVATAWLRRFLGGVHVAVSFEEWVQGRRFPNPNPRGRKKEILFKSLPVPEQEKIRARWQQGQRAQTPAQASRVKDPLFHTTSHASLEEIAEKGLSPRSGGGTFEHGGYGEHSQGKVFLSDNPEAARAWQDKVFQQLEDRHGDSDDLGRRVPVMLRIKDRKTERDPVGDEDVPGSRFTGDTVPPEDIEFWHPKKKRWEPVSTWGQGTDPEHAISEKTKDGVYVDDEAFMPADEDAYSRNDAAVRQQEKAEQQRRRQKVDKERAQEEKKRQEQEKAKWLEPKRRREWIDKIKEKGFKSPIPGASTKPGVFDRMWQDRLKVDENGKPLPDYPLEASEKGPALKDTGQETWSGGKIYRADVKDDTFVHFTPQSRAQQILESGKLLADPPHKKFGIEGVQAVSLGYGDYTPEVQTTHTKTDEKDPLVAVVFQTSTSPKRGYIEEVLWDEDVELREPRIISSEKAQELMKKAPQKLSEDDLVLYGEEQQKKARSLVVALSGQQFMNLKHKIKDKDLSFDHIFGDKKRLVIPAPNLRSSFEDDRNMERHLKDTGQLKKGEKIDWETGMVEGPDGRKTKLGKRVDRVVSQVQKKHPEAWKRAKDKLKAHRKLDRAERQYSRFVDAPLSDLVDSWNEGGPHFGLSDLVQVVQDIKGEELNPLKKMVLARAPRRVPEMGHKAMRIWLEGMDDILLAPDDIEEKIRKRREQIKKERNKVRSQAREVANRLFEKKSEDPHEDRKKLTKLRRASDRLLGQAQRMDFAEQAYENWSRDIRKDLAKSIRRAATELTEAQEHDYNAREAFKEVQEELERDDRHLLSHAIQLERGRQEFDLWKAKGKNLNVVISRAPIDVLRMSDHPTAPQKIDSCHTEGKSEFACAVDEAQGTGLVAYVVDMDSLKKVDLEDEEVFKDIDRDVKGITPYARIRLRRFENKEDGSEIAIPEHSVYGTQYKNLLDVVTDWAREAQEDVFEKKPRMKDYTLTGGAYRDTDDAELFNHFFDTDQEFGNTEHRREKKTPHKPFRVPYKDGVLEITKWEFKPRTRNSPEGIYVQEAFQVGPTGDRKQLSEEEIADTIYDADEDFFQKIVATSKQALQGRAPQLDDRGRPEPLVMDWGDDWGDEWGEPEPAQEHADSTEEHAEFWSWMERSYPEVPNPNREGRKDRISPSTLKEYGQGGRYQQPAQQMIQRYWQTYQQQKAKKVAHVWLLRRAKYNPEFLQWAEQQRFPSPKTRDRIKFVSLPDDEKKKIYERWKSMAQGDQAERVKKENRWLVPNPDPKRFEHVKFQIRLDEETAQEDQKRLQQSFGTEDQNEIRDTILDLAGAGGVASLVTSVDVLTWQEGKHEARVKVMGRGKHGLHFDRNLKYENTGDEDRPFYPLVIENQISSVGSAAPPGVGTRMLASQVGAAEQEGFSHIEAEASRGRYLNGYYTWPRLGFNAPFTKKDMQDLEDELPEAAWQVQQLAELDSDRMFDGPAELFHVMAIPEAREWWEREGHSVMAAFSVSDLDGGKAYQLLRAYTEAKAMAEGKTIPEYLAKIAAKRRNMAPRLTKQDNGILDRVWGQARQKILVEAKTKKKASELARFWVWTKVVERALEI